MAKEALVGERIVRDSQGEMDEDKDGLVRCWCGEGRGEGRLLCMLCAAGVLLLVAYYTAAFLLFVD